MPIHKIKAGGTGGTGVTFSIPPKQEEKINVVPPPQIFGPSAVSETRSSFLSIALRNVSLFVCFFCEMNLILHSNNEESQTVDRIKKIY